jgi:Tol biopolymer transport system component
VAFSANGRLQKASLAGGSPQFICSVGDLLGGTWNSDGVILFGERGKALQRVSASGGTPSSAIDFDKARDEISQSGPQFLPDGNRFLYSSTGKVRGEVVLASLDGKTRRVLFQNNTSPAHYAPDPAGGGWIMFTVSGRLFARPFDANVGEFTGEPVVVTDSLANGPSWSASTRGLLSFQRIAPPIRQLTWFARDGKPIGTIAEAGALEAPRISPDGKLVAFARGDQQNYDVWLFDVVGGTPTRFTFEPGTDSSPLWTPDSSRLLYYSERGGDGFIVERPVNGPGAESILLKGRWPDQRMQLGTISQDGHRVSFSRAAGASSRIAFVARPDSTAIAEFDNDTQSHGAISPDGQWMLYAGFSAGNREIFAVPASPAQRSSTIVGRKQLSIAGGTQPTWRADGKEVFYVAADGKMMAVRVEENENSFRAWSPVVLFQTRLADSSLRDYDVTADGQRFLIAHSQESVPVPITVIVNWPKLLEK